MCFHSVQVHSHYQLEHTPGLLSISLGKEILLWMLKVIYTGYPVVAALKQGRSAVWINTASHHKEVDLQTRIANLVSAET